MPRGVFAGLVAVVAILGTAAFALVAGDATSPETAASGLDGRVLEVERQLLCPQCTNKRLDVCDQPICEDMRREIRARLERGESEAQIVSFFAGRFGDRVLASVPKSGFNLWLWGWVLASVGLAGLVAWSWLARSRVRPQERAGIEGAADAADDGWLDAQLREAADADPRETGRSRP